MAPNRKAPGTESRLLGSTVCANRVGRDRADAARGSKRPCARLPELQETTAIKTVWGKSVGKISKSQQHLCFQWIGTERVGFEPTVRSPVQRFSRPLRANGLPLLEDRKIEVQITLVVCPRNHLYRTGRCLAEGGLFLGSIPSSTIFEISPTISISSPSLTGPIDTRSTRPRRIWMA